jgi:metallo-beta-lactamase family protein
MKIRILGAAGGEVTGSAYLVETDRARVLVDCGLFQGGKKADELNVPPIAGNERLDAVLLTHAHLDHTGRLPLLTRGGYLGPIKATPATIELTSLILRDSAKLQVSEAERANRKRKAGQPEISPLYTPEHVEATIQQLAPVPYQQAVEVAPGIRATWAEAGHMLGSGSIQLEIQDNGKPRRVVFSGDLGPKGAPILRDFEPFHRAEMVFLESTYGDRDHRPFEETVKEFIGIVQEAVENGGKIFVPTFAVGRAQLLTMLLAWMFRNKKVRPFPVFLDSPMAIEASKIYQHHPELFDDEMNTFLRQGAVSHDLKTLKLSITADDSKKINDEPGPFLVLAGAGMCNAGRIMHHLRHNLARPETHVAIVGYQAGGTLGRLLVDGKKEVAMFGEKIQVKARIHTLGGFSAHAGQKDLLAWFEAIAPSKPKVVLTHGEDEPRGTLAKLIQQRFALRSTLPKLQDVITL